MKILTKEMRKCSRGPETWFTGTVWLDEIVTGAAPSRLKAIRVVSFEPGSHTAWHTHPVGQALHVLSGVGLVQLKGQPAQAIRSGDLLWIEAGEEHWHGAAPEHTMVHLAMQEMDAAGVHVVWLARVSDKEYAAATQPRD